MDAHRADASRLAGLTLAGIGFAHFTNPRLFTPSTTRRASQRRARLRTYATGIVETMVGLGITNRRTRPLATIFGIGHSVHLIGRHIRKHPSGLPAAHPAAVGPPAEMPIVDVDLPATTAITDEPR